MNWDHEIVLLVGSDSAVAQDVVAGLLRDGRRVQVPIAASLEQARARLERIAPTVILLEESAVDGPPAGGQTRSALDSLESPLAQAVRELARAAPVVVLAAAERQREVARLAELVTAGSVDFVARGQSAVPLAVSLLQRWLQSPAPLQPPEVARRRDEPGEPGAQTFPQPGSEDPAPEDFGEMLRHAVNNPLTGILGNAELLLARRDRLPPQAVERLETIARLAVRLRETIRHLSSAWRAWHNHIPSA